MVLVSLQETPLVFVHQFPSNLLVPGVFLQTLWCLISPCTYLEGRQGHLLLFQGVVMDPTCQLSRKTHHIPHPQGISPKVVTLLSGPDPREKWGSESLFLPHGTPLTHCPP